MVNNILKDWQVMISMSLNLSGWQGEQKRKNNVYLLYFYVTAYTTDCKTQYTLTNMFVQMYFYTVYVVLTKKEV